MSGSESGRRDRLGYQLRYAWQRPERIGAHVRRRARNAWIGVRHRDHVGFYRQVMRHNVAADPNKAIGAWSEKGWLELGQNQFDYLVDSGLAPHHTMLEIGCGNLRGGWRFIDYLDAGNFVGVDISPDILLQAQRTIVKYDLQHKEPQLTPVDNLRLDWLPARRFDVVHAHSVFSHCPLDVVEECFSHVGRVMAPEGFFDFTYNRTDGEPHGVLREDYYYRDEQLIDLASQHGFVAERLLDWNGNRQAKMRLRIAG